MVDGKKCREFSQKITELAQDNGLNPHEFSTSCLGLVAMMLKSSSVPRNKFMEVCERSWDLQDELGLNKNEHEPR